eukprot:2625500-Amphidinium_carterae.1
MLAYSTLGASSSASSSPPDAPDLSGAPSCLTRDFLQTTGLTRAASLTGSVGRKARRALSSCVSRQLRRWFESYTDPLPAQKNRKLDA